MSDKNKTKTSYYITLHKHNLESGYREKTAMDELLKDWQVDIYSDRIIETKDAVLKSVWTICTQMWQPVGEKYYCTIVGGEFVTTLWLLPFVECRYLDFRNYFLDYARYKDLGVSRKIPNFGYFVKEGRVE